MSGSVGTIIFMEGFDHENGIADLQQGIIASYSAETASFELTTQTPFNYGKALNFGWSGVFGPPAVFFNCSESTSFGSVAAYMTLNVGSSAGNGGFGVADLQTGAQCCFTYDTTGTVSIWNGLPSGFNSKTPIAKSAVGVIPDPLGWNHFEFVVQIGSGVNGSVYVRCNGVLAFSATGVNTQGASATTFNQAFLTIANNSNGSVLWDDLYACNLAGNPAGSWHGIRRVQTLFATSNAAVQFTPLANTNWQEVSETAMDGDTSYNYTPTPGLQDTFNMQPLVGNPLVIDGVQVTMAARVDNAQGHQLATVLEPLTTPYVGTPVALPASYSYNKNLYPTNPATGAAWTYAQVNATKAGYNLVA